MCPPSLSPEVKVRAFVAANGEFGILLADSHAFLSACRADNISVLGWELWIIDHTWSPDHNWPTPEAGSWCAGIPLIGQTVPAVVGGSGDVDSTEIELAAFDAASEIAFKWLSFLRVNFTLS